MDDPCFGAIQVLRNADGVWGVSNFPEKGVRFNVISTRGWVGVKFSGKKLYVTLEWPPFVQRAPVGEYLQPARLHDLQSRPATVVRDVLRHDSDAH